MAEMSEAQPLEKTVGQPNESMVGRKIKETKQFIERNLKTGKIQIGTAVAALTMLYNACGGGTEVASRKTPQHFEPGVTVETRIPDQPSQTATVEATRTVEATATPEAKIIKGYNLILNPDVTGPFDARLTPKLFKQKVADIAENILPKIEGVDFDIEIFQGGAPGSANHSYYEFNGIRPRIRINSTETQEKLAFDMAHEFGHMITDKALMKSKLSPQKFRQLENTIDTANHNKDWGLPENADPLEYLMTPDMGEVNFPITKDTPLGVVQATAKRYHLSTTLTGKLNPGGPLKNPLMTQIGLGSPELAFVKDEIQKPQFLTTKHYKTLDEFLEEPQITNLFTRIEAAQPALTIGIEKLKQDSHYFSGILNNIPADTPARTPILGFNDGESVDLTLNFAVYEFMQKLRIKDPQAIGSLTEQDLQTDQKFLNNVQAEAENEGIADQIATALLRPDLNPPASNVIQIIRED